MNEEYKLVNKSKLDSYHLTSSIHTVTIKSREPPNIPANADLEIIRSNYLQKTQMWSTRLNPNKIRGDIFAYSEFCATVNELVYNMGISDFTYYRTDIRLDSYQDDFKAYYKLNMLLINLLSILFNDHNHQAVSHMLTQSKGFCDVSTKNQYWEVKYYDKKFQTNDTDPAKARLEFRSLKSTNVDGYEPHIIKEKWFEKLEKLPSLYCDLQRKCNLELYGAYKAYCNYNSKGSSRKDYATGFLSNYSNSMTIYTRRQLRDFLQMCGLSERTAESRAENIIDNIHIEFFSKADVERYVIKVKKAMNDFFAC